jgi:cytochrome c-type biogenesis protein CcmE
MHPRTKWLAGGVVILCCAGWLMANATKTTGEYYLTPQELAAKVSTASSFVETGVKVGARVLPGSVVRAPGGRAIGFRVSDGAQTYPVVYRGRTPDTFTDRVDAVVEGRAATL